MPHLYSKLAASQELRKMLSIGRADDRNDLSRLSDAELIQQLTDEWLGRIFPCCSNPQIRSKLTSWSIRGFAMRSE